MNSEDRTITVYSRRDRQIGDSIVLRDYLGNSKTAQVIGRLADNPRFQNQSVLDMRMPELRRQINSGEGYYQVQLID